MAITKWQQEIHECGTEWNERTNYIKENNIELGDEFIFTNPEFGEEIYKLILFDGGDAYYYTERNSECDVSKHNFQSMKAFHMGSLFAKSCRKFDREEEINKLLC